MPIAHENPLNHVQLEPLMNAPAAKLRLPITKKEWFKFVIYH